jgi:hypothetical protein
MDSAIGGDKGGDGDFSSLKIQAYSGMVSAGAIAGISGVAPETFESIALHDPVHHFGKARGEACEGSRHPSVLLPCRHSSAQTP